ncbi:hypothetical protein OHA72_38505 [Dactylosporangium sp. NBC_01737]|uniref:hypothetical protein n=1 Tax=Dactylosporangium sp. NBC_01737 TaxID=2975959 RepID=UPI002E13CFE9|nr:hypothetical protein OHA72_38505 [Dactylosporangium sp. NBC_01737]
MGGDAVEAGDDELRHRWGVDVAAQGAEILGHVLGADREAGVVADAGPGAVDRAARGADQRVGRRRRTRVLGEQVHRPGVHRRRRRAEVRRRGESIVDGGRGGMGQRAGRDGVTESDRCRSAVVQAHRRGTHMGRRGRRGHGVGQDARRRDCGVRDGTRRRQVDRAGHRAGLAQMDPAEQRARRRGGDRGDGRQVQVAPGARVLGGGHRLQVHARADAGARVDGVQDRRAVRQAFQAQPGQRVDRRQHDGVDAAHGVGAEVDAVADGGVQLQRRRGRGDPAGALERADVDVLDPRRDGEVAGAHVVEVEVHAAATALGEEDVRAGQAVQVMAHDAAVHDGELHRLPHPEVQLVGLGGQEQPQPAVAAELGLQELPGAAAELRDHRRDAGGERLDALDPVDDEQAGLGQGDAGQRGQVGDAGAQPEGAVADPGAGHGRDVVQAGEDDERVADDAAQRVAEELEHGERARLEPVPGELRAGREQLEDRHGPGGRGEDAQGGEEELQGTGLAVGEVDRGLDEQRQVDADGHQRDRAAEDQRRQDQCDRDPLEDLPELLAAGHGLLDVLVRLDDPVRRAVGRGALALPGGAGGVGERLPARVVLGHAARLGERLVGAPLLVAHHRHVRGERRRGPLERLGEALHEPAQPAADLLPERLGGLAGERLGSGGVQDGGERGVDLPGDGAEIAQRGDDLVDAGRVAGGRVGAEADLVPVGGSWHADNPLSTDLHDHV